jgi:hypothetical protein
VRCSSRAWVFYCVQLLGRVQFLAKLFTGYRPVIDMCQPRLSALFVDSGDAVMESLMAEASNEGAGWPGLDARLQREVPLDGLFYLPTDAWQLQDPSNNAQWVFASSSSFDAAADPWASHDWCVASAAAHKALLLVPRGAVSAREVIPSAAAVSHMPSAMASSPLAVLFPSSTSASDTAHDSHTLADWIISLKHRVAAVNAAAQIAGETGLRCVSQRFRCNGLCGGYGFAK